MSAFQEGLQGKPYPMLYKLDTIYISYYDMYVMPKNSLKNKNIITYIRTQCFLAQLDILDIYTHGA